MITKSIPYAGRYSSSTFNAGPQKSFAGRNGVVQGGAVTTSGGIATIQPLTWIQRGLFASSDTSLTVTVPLTLTAPYYIVVTTSTPVFNPAEVVTPTFAKRPQDVGANSVLVAEWDGQEWRPLPHVQLGGLIGASQNESVRRDMIGIAEGFDVTVGATIDVSAGSLTDRQGQFATKTESVSFALPTADADGYDRIDEIVFRRPDDSQSRIGTIQRVIGQIYDPSDAVVVSHTTQIGNVSYVNSAAKTLVDSTTNTSYFLYKEVNGGTTSLILKSSPDLMSSYASIGTATTNFTYFDAILGPSGNIDIVFVRGLDLIYKQIDFTGSDVISESILLTDTVTLSNPKVVSVTNAGSYYLHVVYERADTAFDHRLNYIRVTPSGAAVAGSSAELVNMGVVLTNPSLAKDDDDSQFYLAFENQTAGKIYLRTYDAQSLAQVGSTLELEDDSYIVTSATVAAASGSTQPIVHRTANKDTVVFWRQDKGSSVYGVAMYSPRYFETYGHKAFIVDLTAPGEDISLMAADVDELSCAHFLVAVGTNVVKSTYRLDTLEKLGAHGNVATSVTAGSLGTAFNSKGSLVQTWANSAGSATSFAKTTAGVHSNLRGFTVPPTDVFLSHYRVSDGALSVAGVALEENSAITRLYEFMNCFPSGGQISWQIAGANTLVTSAIPINFYNREATYTIPLNTGLVIGLNQIAYVVIPDTDATASLTLEVASFGTGILDRYGKTAFPLFWNVGGVLYMRFAPYRLSADGETIQLGDSVSLELLKYVSDNSTPIDSTPDYTDHNYSSIVGAGLAQSDGHDVAIGKLDAAIDALNMLVQGVPFSGYIREGTNLSAVSGGSTDVSSVLIGKVPGGSAIVQGVVTDPPYNKVLLRNTDDSDMLVDALGNVVYGRLTYAASVWTLTFYVLIAAVETPYSFGVAANISWYYQEIFSPLSPAAPVFSEFAMMPSDNATTDVVDASATQRGLVNLTAQSFTGAKSFVNSIATQKLDVASAATIIALSSAESYVKLTGVIVTDLQGIAAGTDGQILTLNNATNQIITARNQNGGAIAANRLVLPNNADIPVPPGATLEFIYDVGQSRWVIKSGSGSGGGGGTALIWVEDDNAPLSSILNRSRVYSYSQGLAQQLFASVKVPSTYVIGSAIKLYTVFYSPDSSGTALMSTLSTLIRTGTDLITSTTNQRVSTNAAVTLSGGTADIPQSLVADITSADGKINSVSVSPGDIIIIGLYRDASDTAASDVDAIVNASEITFS